MRPMLVLLAFVLAVSWGGVASADVAKGQKAFDRGDIHAALQAWGREGVELDLHAQHCMGRIMIITLRDERGVALIRAGAESGHLPAQVTMAQYRMHGLYMRPDRGLAEKWYRRAASHSAEDEATWPFSAARAHLITGGFHQHRGEMKKAVEQYRIAADAGNATAQAVYGERLEEGNGTKVDLIRAHLYFVLSWKQGNAAAKKRAPAIRKKMSKEEFEESRALVRKWMTDKKAGTVGAAYNEDNRISDGERRVREYDVIHRAMLDFARALYFSPDDSCRSVWLHSRKFISGERGSGTSVEHMTVGCAAEQKVLRVVYRRAEKIRGRESIRWSISLLSE